MRLPLLVLGIAACNPDPKATPTDPADPLPTDPVPDEQTTTPSTSTTSPSTSTTSTPTTPPPPASLPPVPCPWPIDVDRLADCAASGDAAFLGSTGYPDIQQAIDAAAAGDTITVCPGSWPANVTLGNHKILAAADPTPGVTAIEGGGANWLLEVTNATVQGLTLRSGMRSIGGGAITASGDVLLECVVADNNSGTGPEPYGGAIRSDGNLTVRYSSFHGNSSRYAGGAISASRLVVEDTSFTENFGRSEGGGIYSTEAVEVRRCDFSENESHYAGGGISGVGTFYIEDSTFTRNVGDYQGGAVSVGAFDPVTLEIVGSTFDENHADYSAGAVSIGAWATDPTVITDSIFEANTSGGIAAIDFVTWGGVDLTITGCTFAANQGEMSGAIGSGGWLDDGGTIVLRETIFEDNVATVSGGGILDLWSENGPVAITGTDLSVLRNSGTNGALSLGSVDHVFTCTNCDFGTGADDNVPGDATKASVFTAELGLDFVL